MPCPNDLSASLIPMDWMAKEAREAGLNLESHCFQSCTDSYLAELHPSKRHFYRIRGEHIREIDHGHGDILIHESVKYRLENDPNYEPKNLMEYVRKNGWPPNLEF